VMVKTLDEHCDPNAVPEILGGKHPYDDVVHRVSEPRPAAHLFARAPAPTPHFLLISSSCRIRKGHLALADFRICQ
jgi:hypothetical protein